MTDFGDVLWVDDDTTLLTSAERAFPGLQTAKAGTDALRQLHAAALGQVPYRVLVVDVLMPGMDGIEVCREARAISPTTRRVLITGAHRLIDAETAVNVCGVSHLFEKPFAPDMVRRVLLELRTRRSDSQPRMVAVVPAERIERAARAYSDGREALRRSTMPFRVR